MKALDIALKDLTTSTRSAFALIFMFGVPLLVTGMFYFMFGNIASQGDFDLPQTSVIIANLDKGGPRLQAGSENIPGDIQADTLSDCLDLLEESLPPLEERPRILGALAPENEPDAQHGQ